MSTTRLTVGQAVVRFLPQQFTERDGREQRLIEGCFGIFGHGNLAGLGQALLESELQSPGALVYRQGRNEQGMVHAAAAFARFIHQAAQLILARDQFFPPRGNLIAMKGGVSARIDQQFSGPGARSAAGERDGGKAQEARSAVRRASLSRRCWWWRCTVTAPAPSAPSTP